MKHSQGGIFDSRLAHCQTWDCTQALNLILPDLPSVLQRHLPKIWRRGSIGYLLIQKRIQQGNANMETV
jgi:hypothetical protein